MMTLQLMPQPFLLPGPLKKQQRIQLGWPRALLESVLDGLRTVDPPSVVSKRCSKSNGGCGKLLRLASAQGIMAPNASAETLDRNLQTLSRTRYPNRFVVRLSTR